MTCQCSKCGVEKPIDKFHKDKSMKDGYRKTCRECVQADNRQRDIKNKDKVGYKDSRIRARRKWAKKNRDKYKFYQIKSKYGITEEQYYSLIESQNNLCPICGESLNGGSQIDLDHNPQIGKGIESIRGVLHSICNKGIGCLKHNPSILENAAKYLRKYPEQE